MFEIETYTLLVSALYGFSQALPFNTYGESLILVVQTVLILALVYHFSSTGWLRRTAVMAAYVALVLAVVQGALPRKAFEQRPLSPKQQSNSPSIFIKHRGRYSARVAGQGLTC